MCVSRPRRFGKTMNVSLLTAYYSKGCNSKDIFSNLDISRDPDYESHLNKYNVISLSISDFREPGKGIETILPTMIKEIKRELKEEFNYVKTEFAKAIKRSDWKEVAETLKDSDLILEATWNCECEKIAKYIEIAHTNISTTLKYNNEETLSSVVSIAYYKAINYYSFIKEKPLTSQGITSFILYPYENTNKPLIIVELKYYKIIDSTIKSIKEKCYPKTIENYYGKILLVTITYDNEKNHICKIDMIEKVNK